MAVELFVCCCFDINGYNNAIRVHIILQIESMTQRHYLGVCLNTKMPFKIILLIESVKQNTENSKIYYSLTYDTLHYVKSVNKQNSVSIYLSKSNMFQTTSYRLVLILKYFLKFPSIFKIGIMQSKIFQSVNCFTTETCERKKCISISE